MSVEYRVRWRREDWSPTTKTKSRTFSRRHDAARFVEKLYGDDRPELGPVLVWADVREVGSWQARIFPEAGR